MIIFDQDAVAKGLTMIRASAEEDCPFLKRSYTRDCLSRVQDSHGVPTNCVAEPACQGGDT